MTLQTNVKYLLGFSYEKIRGRETKKKKESLMEFQIHLQKYTINIKHIKTDLHTISRVQSTKNINLASQNQQ